MKFQSQVAAFVASRMSVEGKVLSNLADAFELLFGNSKLIAGRPKEQQDARE